MSLLLGYDIGSSSVKASLVEIDSGKTLAAAVSPAEEMEISAPQPGWAEQDPEEWWKQVKLATAMLQSQGNVDLKEVKAIGISYQMHGLVIVDRNQRLLRPSIIWCDSRAVEIGERAFASLGKEKCLHSLLNSPGNFTASKLKWVQENEPEVYSRIYKAMLPGEYIAMRLTGEIKTTPSGLSEGILWDYPSQKPADLVLDYYRISPELLPEVVPVFSVQGEVSSEAATELGLNKGTVVSYRAGDQPNNALSLKVLEPGEIAATAGTSGVVYGVGDQPNYDPQSRVNTFVHVNHTPTKPRYGTLLCINGTAILYRWLKNNMMANISYREMDQMSARVPVGAGGLSILPYGNGAERTLGNIKTGAVIHGLDFNIHSRPHLARAAQEGIVYSLNYGMEIMRQMGINISSIKAGFANMFLSPVFSEAFATISGARVELYNTDGSQGAARGAGIGAGIYQNYQQAFNGLDLVKNIDPSEALSEAYREAYQKWREILDNQLK
ncbi:MAG: xylulokinase [Bacillota bacterium]